MADEENEEINLSELESEVAEGTQKPEAAAAKPPPVPGPTAKPAAAPQTGLQDLERQVAEERAAARRALR